VKQLELTRCCAAYDTTQTNLRMDALRPLLFIGSDLDQTQLERLAKTMAPFAKQPGSTLVSQGEKCGTMFYITQGQLSFFRTPSNGRLRATTVALQKQFDMEERSNALDASRQLSSAEASSLRQESVENMRIQSAFERRNAFSSLNSLMTIGDDDVNHDDGGDDEPCRLKSWLLLLLV
jgi:hypothetical protein